jgi:large subunit ribosomal protein L25
MDRFEIMAHRREAKGKGRARKLRRQGMIPAVLYGPRIESAAVSCELKDVLRVLQHGQNVLINLKIRDGAGGQDESEHLVMIRDLQVHPVKGVPIHADLYEVSMKETMTVAVPIRLVGKAEGTRIGGILEQARRELEVECLPGDLPPHIEVDVSHLNIGDSIHVRDIMVDRVKVLTEPHLTIATVVPPMVEKEAVPAVEAVVGEEEVAAEGPPEAEKEKES